MYIISGVNNAFDYLGFSGQAEADGFAHSNVGVVEDSYEPRPRMTSIELEPGPGRMIESLGDEILGGFRTARNSVSDPVEQGQLGANHSV